MYISKGLSVIMKLMSFLYVTVWIPLQKHARRTKSGALLNPQLHLLSLQVDV